MSLHCMINVGVALRMSTQICNSQKGFKTKSMSCSTLLTKKPGSTSANEINNVIEIFKIKHFSIELTKIISDNE